MAFYLTQNELPLTYATILILIKKNVENSMVKHKIVQKFLIKIS